MSEEESKPKVLPPPTEAERALAKKLGRALGRQPTGASALGRNPTASDEAPSSRKGTGATTPVTAPPKSDPTPSQRPDKEAILAARRASVQGSEQKSIRPTGRGPAHKPRARKSIIALGVVLLIAALVSAGFYAKQMLDARSPAGRVRNELLSWELAGADAEREQAFGNLDREAPWTVLTAIELLSDTSRAERGDSNSQRTIQVVAHYYLMHYAAVVKAQPPKEAQDIAKRLFEGAPVPSDAWTASRKAWGGWVAEQQAKGAVPKS
jgi:hypothetical protein